MAIKNAHLLVSQSLNTKYVLEGVSETPPEGDKINFTQISIPSVGYTAFVKTMETSPVVHRAQRRYLKNDSVTEKAEKKSQKNPLLPKPRLPEEVPP